LEFSKSKKTLKGRYDSLVSETFVAANDANIGRNYISEE
jgi:hypothetical protein